MRKTHNCEKCYFYVTRFLYGESNKYYCKLHKEGKPCNFIANNDKKSVAVYNIKNLINHLLDDIREKTKSLEESLDFYFELLKNNI